MCCRLTSCALGYGDERLGLWVQICWLHVETNELYIIVEPDNLASLGSFDILLANIPGLIVEQSMRISTPCHTPHVHSNIEDNRQFR